LLSLRNDAGLLAEQYAVRDGRLVGSFPQALSHIALVNTAYLSSAPSHHYRHTPGKAQPAAKHPLQADAQF
jgi:hypothetical protein